ncbi:MAG: HAD-IC family P-type ATPase, partial [Micrococcales bacterium]
RNKINVSVHDLVAADAVNSAGNTAVFIVRDEQLLGFIAIVDTLRETSKQAVAALQEQGIKVAMLSGDAQGVAQSVAKELGIDEVYAEVLPHQKNEIVARIQAEKKTVVMVGDGVNDAPALALADVGIAIGAGTDVAIESAGVVLVSSDPVAVGEAIKLSKRSYSKMVQNLWWAAGYNILAIPLAAGAGESFGLVLTPAVGAVLMSLSTIIVAANAQLLWRRK